MSAADHAAEHLKGKFARLFAPQSPWATITRPTCGVCLGNASWVNKETGQMRCKGCLLRQDLGSPEKKR